MTPHLLWFFILSAVMMVVMWMEIQRRLCYFIIRHDARDGGGIAVRMLRQ